MKPLLPSLLRLATGAFVCLQLGGCIELVPRDVEENVVIHQDGRIEVTYQGTFNDLREVAKAVAADQGEKIPSDEELRDSTVETLKDDPLVTEVTELPDGVYRLRWHEEGNLSEGKTPELLAPSYGSDKIPRLLQMTRFRSLSSVAFGITSIEQEDMNNDSELPPDSRTSKVIQGYLDRFKGTVSVRIDPSLVLKHNATSAVTESDGMMRLQWSLTMPMKQTVELLLTFDKRDFPVFKLMDAPAGSSCKELIGSNCKCGPFRIVDPMGTAKANTPYEITGPAGVQRGCTDAEGDTIAIESPVTGSCQVRLLLEAAAVAECRPH